MQVVDAQRKIKIGDRVRAHLHDRKDGSLDIELFGVVGDISDRTPSKYPEMGRSHLVEFDKQWNGYSALWFNPDDLTVLALAGDIVYSVEPGELDPNEAVQLATSLLEFAEAAGADVSWFVTSKIAWNELGIYDRRRSSRYLDARLIAELLRSHADALDGARTATVAAFPEPDPRSPHERPDRVHERMAELHRALGAVLREYGITDTRNAGKLDGAGLTRVTEITSELDSLIRYAASIASRDDLGV